MNGFEDFKKYLPQYLTPESQKELYDGLKQFPPEFDNRMFSTCLIDEVEVFQGDGLREMPVTNLPNTEIAEGPVLVLSNSCDISSTNQRIQRPSIFYCPIVKLSKLTEQYAIAGMSEKAISDMAASIRAQKITRFFYLPQHESLPDECVGLLDHIVSSSVSVLDEVKIVERRLFSLSNLGFYLFLVKLGIHFTRVFEDVDRG